MIIPIISYHKNCHFPKANRRWSHRGDLKINYFRCVCSAKYSFDTLYSRPQTPLFSLDLSPPFELCSAFVFGVTFPPFFLSVWKVLWHSNSFFSAQFFFFFGSAQQQWRFEDCHSWRVATRSQSGKQCGRDPRIEHYAPVCHADSAFENNCKMPWKWFFQKQY